MGNNIPNLDHWFTKDVQIALSSLKKEIENLKTKVEIESIRAEIYNLKMLAQQK